MCCFVCRISRKLDLLYGGYGGRCLEYKEKNGTPLWEKTHLQGKMGEKKKKTVRSEVLSAFFLLKKMHAEVATSLFANQNL